MSQNETTTATGASAAEEQTSTIIRVAVLVVFTLCFASLWSQVQPDPELLAQRQQIVPNMSMPLSNSLPTRAMARITPAPAMRTAVERAPAVPAAEAIPQPVSSGSDVLAISQSLTIVRDGLLLSNDELMQHIRQLPMGTPDGNYRIVDAQGGTGWLRVRMNSAIQSAAAAGSDNIVTTTVAGSNVTFIRVQSVAAHRSPQTVR
ncbi:MAG: hypothetical protein KDA90_14690 [Planctomycetaceae bacterium]|nr:hypothetical protein [Planctomycetaceae bacterium]